MIEKPKPEVSLSNDVQVIRNILLGEHLEEFKMQVETLEKEISDLKQENKTLRMELEAENRKGFQELMAQLEEVKSRQDKSDKEFRKRLDSELQEIHKRLSAYEDNQGGLIASLASALLEYKNKSGK